MLKLINQLDATCDREQNYKYMLSIVESLLKDEKNLTANLSNISAVINMYVDTINWAGFYILEGDCLVLGPFQGKPACVRIPLGKGVCGACAESKKTLIVKNVHEFEGHIACDSDSNSEIVIPILKDGVVFAVLDIDSPIVDRFSELEEKYLTQLAALLENLLII